MLQKSGLVLTSPIYKEERGGTKKGSKQDSAGHLKLDLVKLDLVRENRKAPTYLFSIKNTKSILEDSLQRIIGYSKRKKDMETPRYGETGF